MHLPANLKREFISSTKGEKREKNSSSRRNVKCIARSECANVQPILITQGE
jgi:hypothetical protein